jgi:hypothetical protein
MEVRVTSLNKSSVTPQGRTLREADGDGPVGPPRIPQSQSYCFPKGVMPHSFGKPK